ncbi:MAG: MCE family protein [Acidobacteria bacterium]|nr:MCE family protein [Acidobacteriota bacterium]
MERKRQVVLAEIKLGIVVTIALLLTAALILQQSWGVNWFAKSAPAITYLPDVGGLKPGAPVWLAGIEIGKVREVTIVPPEVYAGNEPLLRRLIEVHRQLDSLDPKAPRYRETLADLHDQLRDIKSEVRLVEVKLDVRKEYVNRLSRDSEVSIESRGLIGDSFIEISPGSYGIPPVIKDGYYLIEGVRTTGFREIMTGANDVIANFGVLSEQFRDIAVKINADRVGSGVSNTLADFQHALQKADRTFQSATALLDEMRKGEGTVGKLVADPTLYRRLTEALEKFNATLEQIQSGNGTMAKLMHDPSLYDHAKETLRKADLMMDRIERGEGTLGRLSKDDALYDNTKRALDRFASLVDQIERGEGTMGKLLKDPSLYNNLNESTAEITKLIYDLRQDPKKYLSIRFRLF